MQTKQKEPLDDCQLSLSALHGILDFAHQMKNTLDCKFALPGPGLTRYGVAYAIAQFSSQFDAVVIESDLARTLSGKISPVTTQAQGPQLQAKKKM